jgi:hypothetical protein
VQDGSQITNGVNGNSTANPLFVSSSDFSLQNGSPAINAGDNNLYNLVGNLATDKDLAGNARLDGTTIDMGAYEYQGSTLSVSNTYINKLIVYPNPTSDILNIQSSAFKVQNAKIYDASGKLVKIFNGNSVNVSNLPEGVYVIAVEDGGTKTKMRFIKE